MKAVYPGTKVMPEVVLDTAIELFVLMKLSISGRLPTSRLTWLPCLPWLGCERRLPTLRSDLGRCLMNCWWMVYSLCWKRLPIGFLGLVSRASGLSCDSLREVFEVTLERMPPVLILDALTTRCWLTNTLSILPCWYVTEEPPVLASFWLLVE